MTQEVTVESEINVLVVDGYPPSLAKACFDYFDYALKLKSGDLIYFRQAKPVDKNWVTVSDIEREHSCFKDRHEFNFDRGIDIRVSDIVWVCDAPFGS